MERVKASPGGSLSHSVQEIDSAGKHRIDASGGSTPTYGVSMSLDKGSGFLKNRAPSRCSDDAFGLHDKNNSNTDNKSNDGMLFPRVDYNNSLSAFGKQALTHNQ